MKIYIVSRKEPWDYIDYIDNNKPITALHSKMFHGMGMRGLGDGQVLDYTYFDEYLWPQKIIKNVNDIARIFMPSLNFVISEDVMNEMAYLPYTSFHEVDFIKLYDYPIKVYDNTYLKDKRWKGKDKKFIEKLPHDESFIDQVGNYYELVVPNLMEIADKFNDLKTYEISFEIGFELEKYQHLDKYKKEIPYKIYKKLTPAEEMYVRGDMVEQMTEIQMSESMFETYPIIWWKKTMFNEAAFSIIKEHLNSTYFYVKEYDLADDPKPKPKKIL